MPPNRKDSIQRKDPLWFKDAIIYEVHVRAFHDSSGDGMGDFAGLTRKLPYLQDLGVTALWVLPFCPSPWKDDGYDISNYTDIHPAYGTLRDFQNFLREAHRSGLRVISELVLNHTSDQHVWFQRSRRAAPGSRWRNYYVWSDTPEKYTDARIIFKDFETSNWTWDPVAKAYYWHRFYSHQPDLNYDNPEVRAAMLQAVDFWFDLGVDGLRLDAVPYLYEREGTICENLPETHAFLKELRAHVSGRYPDRMLLAEANQWPEDAIAYFGNGDECHMAFHFPVMPRLFMATRMEDRYPVNEIMQLTPPIPETCQWALFLRNHDELTLEMVTDEERDYMYRVYATDRHMRINLGIRRRLAPLLENDRRRIELMNALLVSLPGTPVIYYGDEIGMGDNFYLGDRNGVRTPMQWSADRNAGFSRANPQKLYLPVIIDPEYHYEAVNVETQQNNPHSLLWWMKRTIAQRKQWKAFGRGSLEFLYPENRRVLAFVRSFEEERILVVANLSRFAQCTELDLSRFQGMAPLELFGHAEFPPITEQPYFLSLGPHAFYWFALQPKQAAQQETLSGAGAALAVLPIESWEEVFSPELRQQLQRMFPGILRTRPWFQGVGRQIRLVEIADVVPYRASSSFVLVLRVEYTEGDPEFYLISLAVARGPEAERIAQQERQFVLSHVRGPDGSIGVLYSALRKSAFCEELLGTITRRRRMAGERGELTGAHSRSFRKLLGSGRPTLEPSIPKLSQDNTTVVYGERFALKVLRRLEEGPHPENEMTAFLSETGFEHVPPYAGSLTYKVGDGDAMVAGVLEGFVPHASEAWDYTLHHLGLFFEHAMAQGKPPEENRPRSPLAMVNETPPEPVRELMSPYLESARLLGARTAEMHAALAGRPEDATFAPEPFTDFYRHSLYHGMIGVVGRSLAQLRARLPRLSPDMRKEAEPLLARENEIRARFQRIRDERFAAMRIRVHGDYHLGQVLYTGKDFVIIDFEGDPGRPLGERRIKRSPLRDVASMIDSFYHASHGALYGGVPGVMPSADTAAALGAWASLWYRWASVAFLNGYLGAPGIASLLPASRTQQRVLVEAFLLEEVLREMSYELARGAAPFHIPCREVVDVLESQ